MQKKRFFALLVSLFFLFSLVFVGCAPAKKPLTPAPAPTKNVMPQSSDSTKAATIAREVDKITDVKKSTVVVSGTTAYVGLDLAANIEKTKTDAVEKTAMNTAKKAEPTIRTVLVTSDADTVTRLKKVYQGIAAGKPISSFAKELEEIGRRITPKVK